MKWAAPRRCDQYVEEDGRTGPERPRRCRRRSRGTTCSRSGGASRRAGTSRKNGAASSVQLASPEPSPYDTRPGVKERVEELPESARERDRRRRPRQARIRRSVTSGKLPDLFSSRSGSWDWGREAARLLRSCRVRPGGSARPGGPISSPTIAPRTASATGRRRPSGRGYPASAAAL